MRLAVLVCGVVSCLAVHGAAAGPVGGGQPDPLCAVASDASYGVTPEQPVPVGGGLSSGIERERRYLDALRGPLGQPLRYSRIGSTAARDPDDGPIDMYTITFDGQTTPVTLYLDIYHLDEPKAPHGFRCGRPLTSGIPSPDRFMATEQLHEVAAAIAAAPGFRAGPVDLGGEPPMGLLLDAFRVRSRRERQPMRPAIGARGVPPPAMNPAPAVAGTTVLAFPETCGGTLVAASAVTLVAPDGADVQTGTLESGTAAVSRHFPGQSSPAGSVVATFAADALQEHLQVRVAFNDPACGAPRHRVSALSYSRAELVESPMPARPADDTSGTPWVAVQAIIDHQGAVLAARALGGPPALGRVAEAAVGQWRARPARAGGAPMAVPVVLQVTFRPPN